MKWRWSMAAAQPLLAAELAASFHTSPLLGQCLINRGLLDSAQASRFLDPRLRLLSDPFLLPGMRAAVDRLFLAHSRQERLVIFGDYDVDGVTSTALLIEVLASLGWTVQCYLPHRLDEGYGLSPDAVDRCLHKNPATLLIAVDCGSTATSTIARLQAAGIDTIVLDHHQISAPPPPALAVINPQLLAPEADFRGLCSVGLAFKLAHAVVKHGRQVSLPGADLYDVRPLLDLVALGTIADLVPLTGENRILVSAGLDHLNRRRRPGVDALATVARVQDRIDVFEVGFQLAPRLNAAGRLENALQSLELLLATERARAEDLARALDAHNRERQQIERTMADQAIQAVRARFNPAADYVIVEGQMPWHVGVVGIVASRVLREFYRPTVIIGGDGDEWRGSGRSIDGFDLAAALQSCSDLLTRHGGHAMAAGLSLPTANLDAFRTRLNELARRVLSPAHLQPVLRIDAEARLDQLSLSGLAELERLRPLGQGNPPVHLMARNLRHQRPPQRLGKHLQHAKFWVTDGIATHQAIWWNCPEPSFLERFDLAFLPERNEYDGRQFVQLRVLDWRPA